MDAVFVLTGVPENCLNCHETFVYCVEFTPERRINLNEEYSKRVTYDEEEKRFLP